MVAISLTLTLDGVPVSAVNALLCVHEVSIFLPSGAGKAGSLKRTGKH